MQMFSEPERQSETVCSLRVPLWFGRWEQGLSLLCQLCDTSEVPVPGP